MGIKTVQDIQLKNAFLQKFDVSKLTLLHWFPTSFLNSFEYILSIAIKYSFAYNLNKI